MTLTALTADRIRLNAGDIVNGLEFVSVRGDRKIMLRKTGTVDGKNYATLSYDAAKIGVTVENTWNGPLDRRQFAKGGKFHNDIMVRVYERFQGAL